MPEEKSFPWLMVALPLAALAVLLIAAIFAWQADVTGRANQDDSVMCTQDAMLCPDGTYVGRTGPNCEFVCPTPQSGEVYRNNQYGFELTMPQDWKGYSILEQKWQGTNVATGNIQFEGPRVVIRNPNWVNEQPWQDIPIMVFTKEQWNLVAAEQIAVSAAPVGPSKLGENQTYIFALPPRWVGFTGAQGQDSALAVSQTFKAF